MTKEDLVIEVDILPVSAERMESFIDFLAELIAEKFIEEKTSELKNIESKD